MKASKYFRMKPVNVVNQNWNPDGTVEIVIYKKGWKRPYKFKVKNYGKRNEVIVEDEEVKEK